METERTPHQETVPLISEEREGSQRFPIREIVAPSRYEGFPDLPQGVMVHYLQQVFEKKCHQFKMRIQIDGMDYVFSLGETVYDSYHLSFKTNEYEYATVNLSEEGKKLLGETIAGFIESASVLEGSDIKSIDISPADASYSKEEIEECVDEIMASPHNTHSRKELMTWYKGYQIFDYYQSTFHKEFHEIHYNNHSRAGARSRYFKTLFRKYLPEWQIDDEPALNSFRLVR